jgi:hypothetical protein
LTQKLKITRLVEPVLEENLSTIPVFLYGGLNLMKLFRTTQNLVAILVLSALVGCATAIPYKTPLVGTSKERKQQIYAKTKARADWWNGVRIGGLRVNVGLRPYSESVATFYRESGDETSAELAEKANPYYWWGGGLALAALFSGVGYDVNHHSNQNFGLLVGAALGISLELTLIETGSSKYIGPSVDSFNHYLRKDMGLDQ